MWWRAALVASVLIVVFVLSGWAKVLPPKDVENVLSKTSLPVSVYMDFHVFGRRMPDVLDVKPQIESGSSFGKKETSVGSDCDKLDPRPVRRDQVALCGRGHQRSCGGTIFGALGGILRVSDSTIHKYQLPYEEERLEYGYDSEPQRIFCKLTGICSQPVLIGGTLPTLAFYTLGIGLGGVAGWACANVRYYLGGSLLILGILIAWCGVLLPW
jgi:hypothetical protein